MSVTTPSLEQQQSQVRIDLAAMFRLTADFGWDDTIWNHITARVPGTDHHFYMHRFGLSYDEVCASNLIKVDEEGKVLEGPKDLNTAGFIIHSAIHLNHPEAKFVFHAHPASAIAATAFKEIPFLVQDSSMLYGNVGYHDWEGLSVDPDERFRIAENMGSNSCLVMRNHGFLTVGKTAGECFMNMYCPLRPLACQWIRGHLISGPLLPNNMKRSPRVNMSGPHSSANVTVWIRHTNSNFVQFILIRGLVDVFNRTHQRV
jgi:ribulose-5-phosphate 4-epimerase/fuculose-1-phosphate aldolase